MALPGISGLSGLRGLNQKTREEEQLDQLLNTVIGSQQGQPQPTPEESMLGVVGDAGLSALGYVGTTLDKPGASIRGLLAGSPREAFNFVPFSDTIGITDGAQNNPSGRDLLEGWGLAPKNKPGAFNSVEDFLWDAAGFGLEIATDPLTYVTGGIVPVLNKLGKTAKATNALDEFVVQSAKKGIGKREALATGTFEDMKKTLKGDLVPRERVNKHGQTIRSEVWSGAAPDTWDEFEELAKQTNIDLTGDIAANFEFKLPGFKRYRNKDVRLSRMFDKVAKLDQGDSRYNKAFKVAYDGLREIRKAGDALFSSTHQNITSKLGRRAATRLANRAEVAEFAENTLAVQMRERIESMFDQKVLTEAEYKDWTYQMETRLNKELTDEQMFAFNELLEMREDSMVKGLNRGSSMFYLEDLQTSRFWSRWFQAAGHPFKRKKKKDFVFNDDPEMRSRHWRYIGPEVTDKVKWDSLDQQTRDLSGARAIDEIITDPDLQPFWEQGDKAGAFEVIWEKYGPSDNGKNLFHGDSELISKTRNDDLRYTGVKDAAGTVVKDGKTQHVEEFIDAVMKLDPQRWKEGLYTQSDPLVAQVRSWVAQRQILRAEEVIHDTIMDAFQEGYTSPNGISLEQIIKKTGQKTGELDGKKRGALHWYAETLRQRFADPQTKSGYADGWEWLRDLPEMPYSGKRTRKTYDLPGMPKVPKTKEMFEVDDAAREAWEKLKGLTVDEDLAADLTRLIEPFSHPESLNPLIQFWKDLTVTWKSGVTSQVPKFHGRNFTSGQIRNKVAGLFSLNSLKASSELINTGNIQKYQKDLDSIAKTKHFLKWQKEQGRTTATNEDISAYIKEVALAGDILPSNTIIHDAADIVQGGVGQNVIAPDNPAWAGDRGLGSVGGVFKEAAQVAGGKVEGKDFDWREMLTPWKWDYATEGRSIAPWRTRGFGGAEESSYTLAKAGEIVGDYVEGLNRLTPFIEGLKKGEHPQLLASKIKKMHIDYSGKRYSEVEKRYMTQLAPFYKFAKGNTMYVGEELLEKPGGHVAKMIRAGNYASADDPLLPERIREAMSAPLWTTEDNEGNQNQQYMTGFGLMHEGALPFLALPGVIDDPQQGAQTLASLMHPMLKLGTETATGASLWQAGPLGGRPLIDQDPLVGRLLSNIKDTATGSTTRSAPNVLPRFTEQLIANSPISSHLTAARKMFDPRKDIVSKVLGATTGTNIATVNEKTREAIGRELSTETMAQMGAKQYKVPYFPEDVLAEKQGKALEAAMILQEYQNSLRRKRREEKKEQKERLKKESI